MSIEEKVKDILLQILDVNEKDITPSAHLRQNLSASSVDLVEILADLENEFNLEISEEDGQGLLTVQTIIDYVTANAK